MAREEIMYPVLFLEVGGKVNKGEFRLCPQTRPIVGILRTSVIGLVFFTWYLSPFCIQIQQWRKG